MTDPGKNYKRGLSCLASGHGRTWEYPKVYLVIEGFSARVLREVYTHIGGSPTRLQASTRYIHYSQGFSYVTPPSIAENKNAVSVYQDAISNLSLAMKQLEELRIPQEDIGMLLPLGMQSKMVMRTNLRHLVEMSHQRLCARAYWEFQDLMLAIMRALASYSEEWSYLVEKYFQPKCEWLGYCTEKKSCGRWPQQKNC